MSLKRRFIVFIDNLEDKKLEKALSYDDPKMQEKIITKGLGKELWQGLIGKSNYYGAKVAGYSDSDINEINKDNRQKFSVNKVFYSYLFFMLFLPFEVLYKFICDLFDLKYFPK